MTNEDLRVLAAHVAWLEYIITHPEWARKEVERLTQEFTRLMDESTVQRKCDRS